MVEWIDYEQNNSDHRHEWILRRWKFLSNHEGYDDQINAARTYVSSSFSIDEFLWLNDHTRAVIVHSPLTVCCISSRENHKMIQVHRRWKGSLFLKCFNETIPPNLSLSRTKSTSSFVLNIIRYLLLHFLLLFLFHFNGGCGVVIKCLNDWTWWWSRCCLIN